MSMGGGMTSAYVYLKQTYKDIKSATLHYKDAGGDWKTMEDAKYPYEFTVERPDDKPDFEFYIETAKLDGSTGKSNTTTLTR
jgi:hypothetical protein